MRTHRWSLVSVPEVGLLLLVLAAAGCRSAPRIDPDFARCIWVDRWSWRTAADVERIVGECADAGFGAVMWQVRGNGTALYRSELEPWSERFGFRDPGFDPLAVAVAAAHRRGLRLHAWVNAIPGWAGVEEPADRRQLWRARRDWFLHDRDGAPQIRKQGKYLALNPCRKEVRDHVAAVCRELATRYELDGIHLDYIRFPDEQGDIVDELGRDPVTLAAFTASTGRLTTDLEALRRWQTQCVTATVAAVREAIDGGSKGRCLLSVAVFADRERALRLVRQDWPTWARKGLVDALFPMNYTSDDGTFAARTADAVAHARGVPVIAGVGVHLHGTPEQSLAQMRRALHEGASGVAVFGYRALYGEPGAKTPAPKRELRDRLSEWLPALAKG